MLTDGHTSFIDPSADLLEQGMFAGAGRPSRLATARRGRGSGGVGPDRWGTDRVPISDLREPRARITADEGAGGIPHPQPRGIPPVFWVDGPVNWDFL